jgi:hypothetical protein
MPTTPQTNKNAANKGWLNQKLTTAKMIIITHTISMVDIDYFAFSCNTNIAYLLWFFLSHLLYSSMVIHPFSYIKEATWFSSSIATLILTCSLSSK